MCYLLPNLYMRKRPFFNLLMSLWNLPCCCKRFIGFCNGCPCLKGECELVGSRLTIVNKKGCSVGLRLKDICRCGIRVKYRLNTNKNHIFTNKKWKKCYVLLLSSSFDRMFFSQDKQTTHAGANVDWLWVGDGSGIFVGIFGLSSCIRPVHYCCHGW